MKHPPKQLCDLLGPEGRAHRAAKCAHWNRPTTNAKEQQQNQFFSSCHWCASMWATSIRTRSRLMMSSRQSQQKLCTETMQQTSRKSFLSGILASNERGGLRTQLCISVNHGNDRNSRGTETLEKVQCFLPPNRNSIFTMMPVRRVKNCRKRCATMEREGDHEPPRVCMKQTEVLNLRNLRRNPQFATALTERCRSRRENCVTTKRPD